MTDDELRADVRKWLADNWNPDIDRGSWAHIVVDAGWATPSWEPEFYGRGLTDGQSRLVAAEFAAVGAHGCGHDRGNLFACTLHEVGTEEQKRRLIRVGNQRPEGLDIVRQDGRLRDAGGPDRLECAQASRY